MITNTLKLLRIKDWLKNVIIFLPLIFSGNLKYEYFYFDLVAVFFLFSLTSSFIYIINDIVDIEDDKKHPLKINKKPLASNKLSIRFALIILIFISFILILSFFKFSNTYKHLILYLFLNLSYTFYFKRVPVLDVLIIGFGYLIRLDVGSVIIEVNTSLFLAGAIFFLANFIIFIKRLVQLSNFKNKNLISFYSKNNLNILILISSFFFFLTLFIFIFLKKIQLIFLIPILIFVFFRYYKSAIFYNLGEFPFELIMKEKSVLFCSTLVIIYTIYIYL